VSTITLTVLEYIADEFPTLAELRVRFGTLLDIAKCELLDVFGEFPYILTTLDSDRGVCYACCWEWRNHLGAYLWN